MKRLCCLLFLFSLTAWSPPQKEVDEYNLKAAFIYNFSKYIDWGPYQKGNEFTIGVLGNSPISKPLAEIAITKTVNNKKIVILQFFKPQDVTFCNILFISRHNAYAMDGFLSRLSQGMLTIGEAEGMSEDGAAFNFIIADNKLKFEANLKSISTAGLKASSELLQHAIIVDQ